MRRPWLSGGALLAVIGFALGVLAAPPLRSAVARAIAATRPAPEAAVAPDRGLPDDVVGSLLLFVLAGQSNMSGTGVPDGEPSTDTRVYMFANDYRWYVAREPIDDDRAQVDTVSRDPWAGVGPGLAFAVALLNERPELRVGLIPCARSSSSIRAWQRNLGDHTLYGSCIKRIRAASTAGTLAGILFFQGETDALDAATHPRWEPAGAAWEQYFQRFVTDFRADAGDPRVPFVFAQLATQDAPQDFVHWDTIKAQQERATLPCSAMIVTEDLPLADGLHFTTAAYRVVGRRFASAWLDLRRSGSSC